MANPFADYPTILRHLDSRLRVADLKDLLKDLHLSTSGNKQPLIDRVAAHLSLLRSSHDVYRYNLLKNKILKSGAPCSPSLQIPRPPAATNVVRTTFSHSPNNGAGTMHSSPYNQFATGNASYAGTIRPNSSSASSRPAQTLNFRPSPFYEVVERMSNVATLPYASRNTVSLTFVCSIGALDKIQAHNKAHKVALMCAETTYAFNPSKQLLMEFPNPTEVRVNNQRIQNNLRGMKNKPGTVPPPDITSFVTKTPRLPNRVDITYTCGAEVNKKFGAQVVLLRTHSVEELVARVKNGFRFSKEQVLEKLRKPDDDDIEMASFDLTLKDPLSYMRIAVPCRSLQCKHNQCFDANAFLQINEQTPQWTCPICHIEISGLSAIAVDSYFQDILDNVGQEVDTILVDPQGNWKLPAAADEIKEEDVSPQTANHAYEVLDLDETEDEDAPLKVPAVVPEYLKANPTSRSVTPSLANGQIKRKIAPICIDLTEDSDEEAQSPKRIKQSHSMDNSTQLPDLNPKTNLHSPSDLQAQNHNQPGSVTEQASVANANGSSRSSSGAQNAEIPRTTLASRPPYEAQSHEIASELQSPQSMHDLQHPDISHGSSATRTDSMPDLPVTGSPDLYEDELGWSLTPPGRTSSDRHQTATSGPLQVNGAIEPQNNSELNRTSATLRDSQQETATTPVAAHNEQLQENTSQSTFQAARASGTDKINVTSEHDDAEDLRNLYGLIHGFAQSTTDPANVYNNDFSSSPESESRNLGTADPDIYRNEHNVTDDYDEEGVDYSHWQ